MRATNHNTAFDGQPVKTFVFYIYVNQIFVPSIKHLAKKSGRTQRLNRYGQGKKITLRHILALLKCNFEKHKKE